MDAERHIGVQPDSNIAPVVADAVPAADDQRFTAGVGETSIVQRPEKVQRDFAFKKPYFKAMDYYGHGFTIPRIIGLRRKQCGGVTVPALGRAFAEKEFKRRLMK
jgi:hypothetical protein